MHRYRMGALLLLVLTAAWADPVALRPGAIRDSGRAWVAAIPVLDWLGRTDVDEEGFVYATWSVAGVAHSLRLLPSSPLTQGRTDLFLDDEPCEITWRDRRRDGGLWVPLDGFAPILSLTAVIEPNGGSATLTAGEREAALRIGGEPLRKSVDDQRWLEDARAQVKLPMAPGWERIRTPARLRSDGAASVAITKPVWEPPGLLVVARIENPVAAAEARLRVHPLTLMFGDAPAGERAAQSWTAPGLAGGQRVRENRFEPERGVFLTTDFIAAQTADGITYAITIEATDAAAADQTLALLQQARFGLPPDAPARPAAPAPKPAQDAASSQTLQLAYTQGRTLWLRDLTSGRSRLLLTAPGEAITAIAWTRDGRELLYADGARIQAVDLETKKQRRLVAHSDKSWTIGGIAVHPSKPVVWYTVDLYDGLKDTVASWLWRVDLGGGAPSKVRNIFGPMMRGGPGTTERLVWWPDGSRVVVGLEQTHMRRGVDLRCFDVNGKEHAVPLGEQMKANGWLAACTPVWSADGQRVLWPPATDGMAPEQLVRLVGSGGETRYTLRVRTSGDFDRIVSGDLHPTRDCFAFRSDAGLIVWDVAGRKELWRAQDLDWDSRFAWRP